MCTTSEEGRNEAKWVTLPYEDGADSLWTVEFVSAKGGEIETEAVDVDGLFAKKLRGIAVKESSDSMCPIGDFLYGLDGADLIVGRLDGDKEGFFVEQLIQRF